MSREEIDRIAFEIPVSEKAEMFKYAKSKKLTVSQLCRQVVTLAKINEKLGRVAKDRGRVVQGLFDVLMEVLSSLPEDHKDPRITAALKRFGNVYRRSKIEDQADELEGYRFGLN